MDREYTAIDWERDGPIGIITLNRPENLNAIGPELRDELLDLLERVAFEENLRAVIITGSGKAFSAGGDLEGFLNRSQAHHEKWGHYVDL